jgi:polyhydroxybutyrate depolymerase
MKNISRILTMLALVILPGTVACGPAATAAAPAPAAAAPATAAPATAAPATAAPAAGAAPKPTITPDPRIQAGDSERKLTAGGLERTYTLHVPPGWDSARAVPVVFVFHGHALSVPDVLTYGFNVIADKNGFLVVYPVGEGGDWSVGTCGGGCCDRGALSQVDDIAFVRQILADLGANASIDPKRIYSTGFSSGGCFSYRLACEMSDTFAAIAPVAGALVYAPCQPQQPVSVLHVHGLSDSIVPYAGGTNCQFPRVEQSIATWARLDGCTGSAKVEKQGKITHTVHASCLSGSAVELYTIVDVYHTWPGENIFPTTETIWDFFAAHPKP